MDEDQGLEGERRSRLRAWRWALGVSVAGLLMTGVGVVFGLSSAGEAATGWGALAGAGAVQALAGGLVAWINRPGDTRWIAEHPRTRRDDMQAQRANQLFVFPALGMLFLVTAIEPTRSVLVERGDFGDWIRLLLPVLYAWVTVAIVLGWDGQSLRNRRDLEDELTVVLRVRAMTVAFVVLMAGATAALAVAFIRPELGVLGLMAAIAAGGATAGVRFAWLDREAGRDG